MWTQQSTTFEGKHYSVTEAHCEPRPDPVPMIMVGAFKPKMLRLTAKYADWWNVSSTGIGDYKRMAQELERACVEAGRDPSTIRKTWGGGCICAPTREEAEAIHGELYGPDNDGEDFDFLGTPGEVVEQMRPFVEMGVDYFILDCGGFPRLTTLELLVNEVLPTYRD
jgi:alkanesulfonate monooxygenase SsuD/methylene tetrahydromethanopterin reductase-like flavin-dependent oxidoreductase (luciferase family)